MSEVTKSVIKFAIATCAILAAASFLFMFLITIAYEQKVSNWIFALAPLRQNDQARWAQQPGSLDYSSRRSIQLYSLEQIQQADMYFTTLNSTDQNVTRTLQDVTWQAQHDLIKFNLTNAQESSASSEPNKVTQVNFDALTVWHQMNYKPQYWLAWQALSQVS
jgi:hypothetical protein